MINYFALSLRLTKTFAALLLLLQSSMVSSEQTDNPQSNWRIVTESFFPFSYYDENKRLTGYSVDLVNHLLKNAQTDLKIEVLPWARALSIAESQPDVLIFSLLKTPERLNSFHWLAPLAKLQSFLWTMPTKEANESLDWSKKSIGVLRDSSFDAEVLDNFTVRPNNIIRVNSYEQLVKLLVKGRVDYIAMPEVIMQKPHLQGLFLSTEQPIKLQLLFDETLYLAASKNSDNKRVQMLKELMRKQLRSDEIKTIHKKYKSLLFKEM